MSRCNLWTHVRKALMKLMMIIFHVRKTPLVLKINNYLYLYYIVVVHCLLRNRKAWLKNDGEHCSAATKKHPVTSLHDSKGLSSSTYMIDNVLCVILFSWSLQLLAYTSTWCLQLGKYYKNMIIMWLSCDLYLQVAFDLESDYTLTGVRIYGW